MSVHSDDNTVSTAASDSFWEPGNYKRTTRRIEDGHRLCDDLMKLVHERADIEKSYAKSLRLWAKKYNDMIEKGPEYGTTEAACRGALAEAERRCELHMNVRDRLINDVHNKIKTWQKENFHKTMIHLKDKKDMEDLFKKSQKPWIKLLDKVNKTKSEYHAACKQERSAVQQERNASSDPSSDAARRLAERVQKTHEDMARAKERYEAALREISDYNGRYMEDMTSVFNKCQQKEAERLMFFKETLYNLHKSLNISEDPQLPQIYEDLHTTIGHADHEKDIRWWSNNRGVNMSMNWPAFEEYSEEFRDIVGGTGRLKKGSSATASGGGAGVTLVNQRPEHDGTSKMVSACSADNASVNAAAKTGDNTRSYDSNGEGGGGAEDWDEYATELVDNGEPGVPVKALYDYDGLEDDELSFKAGECFEKLEDEDEQGWCKGRLNGRVGLYPANYVQPV